MGNIESVTEEIIIRLGEHLKLSVSKIKQFIDHFPEPNEKLVYPSLAITSGKPEFRALQPYVFEQTDPVNKKTEAKWVVGIYDFTLQIDLWTRNKEERNDIFELLFNAMNPNVEPMGLSLRLKDYYNLWCRYDFSGHQFFDGEEQSQRGEFRAKLDVLSTCKAVRVKKDYVMETIENNMTLHNESESLD